MVVVALIAGSLGLAAPAFADPSVPDAPTNVRVLSGDGDDLFVSADVPADHGDPIVSYTATCDSSTGGASSSHTDVAPLTYVGLLSLGETYTCTMIATNGQGDSAPSLPSEPVIVFTPGIAGQAVAVPGDGVIYVTPGPDGVLDRSGTTQSFTADCISSDGGTPASHTGPSFSTVVAVTGVTNDKTYSCTMYGTNTYGVGNPTLASDDVVPSQSGIPPGPPDAQTLSITRMDGALRVGFTPPTGGDDPPSSFEVRCVSDNGGVTGDASDATLPIVVSPLDNGKSYSCAGRAQNNNGWSLWSGYMGPFTPGPVPDAPAKPTVDTTGSTITVTFNAPNDNGNAISGYTATCTSSDGGVTRTATGSSPLDVLNATGNSTYTCTVVATNAVGDSAASVASDPVLTDPTVPDAPTNVNAIGGPESASVHFDTPNDGGDPITGYTATCVSSDGGATGTASGSSSPINVTGLTTYKTYSCSVVATNSIGDSLPGTDPNPPEIDPPAPAAPDSVTAYPGDGSLTVSIDAHDGDVITAYAAGCVSSDGGTPGSASGTSSTLTVNGIDNGHTYTCTGTATNDAGTGPGTAAAPVLAGTPFLEGGVLVVGEDGKALVAFAGTAHENAGPILSWSTSCDSNDGGAPGTATGSSPRLTVTGLDNGHTYVCTMRATNVVGAGPTSMDSNAAIPAPGFPPPTDISLARGSGQITVSFTTPADDLGDPISYYVGVCIATDGGVFSQGFDVGSPIVVTGLDNGHEYYCLAGVVHASGAVGVSDFVGPMMPGAAGVPDPPINVVATAGNESASVAFDPPVDNGGDAITGYSASCVSSDGGVTGNVSGASSPLLVTELSAAKTYSCTVVATNGHGDSDTSDPSNAIVVLAGGSAPANTQRPTISGTAMVQRTLTAHRGTWTGNPAPTYSYQWMRCDAQGNHCKGIAHATKVTYRLKVVDTDHTIRVAVIAVNAVGLSYRLSKPTRVVQWIPMSISGPYFYNGSAVVQGGVFSVGAATHGNSVWTTYANGYVLGPRFGPGDGTLVRTTLKQPIVSIVATPTGRGYWMFASDGGIFAFGDAHFYGSTGAKKLVAPIVSMAVTPDGHGYWLFAADGGVFTFGNARFYGSIGGHALDHPVVAMLSTPSGHGYWLVTSNGAVLHFGDATNIGNVKYAFRNDITGIISTGDGYRFVTKTLQLLAPR